VYFHYLHGMFVCAGSVGSRSSLHGRPAGVSLGSHRRQFVAALATRKTRKRVAASGACGSCNSGFVHWWKCLSTAARELVMVVLRLLVRDGGGDMCSDSVGGNDNDCWDHGSAGMKFVLVVSGSEFGLLRFGLL
jgi:hypothetical protein